jgi:hypothetical protein
MLDGRSIDAVHGTLTARFEMDDPRKGVNPLTLSVFDAEGAPLVGAEPKVSPWMPAHGHGSLDTVAVEVDEGVYAAADVYFNMTGLWQLHVDVNVDAAVTDQFVVDVLVH